MSPAQLEQGRGVGPGHSVPSRWQNSVEKEQCSVQFPVDSEVQHIFFNALHQFIQVCSAGAQSSRSQRPLGAVARALGLLRSTHRAGASLQSVSALGFLKSSKNIEFRLIACCPRDRNMKYSDGNGKCCY